MLVLELLGPVVLCCDGARLGLPIKKTQALLILLARAGPMPRARVASMLWPRLDEGSARRNLRRELARLREAGAGQAARIEGDFLALSAELRCDLQDFDEALAQARPDDALALWRGPPADGLSLGDAPEFDDWWSLERERLLQARRRALQASATAHEARGDAAAALARVQSLLDDDPFQEQCHRDAMRLLMALGRREAALAQFERCRQLLQEELGLSPMDETQALAASLRGAGPPRPAPPGPGPAAGTPRDPAPAGLLPEQLPFVGRGPELARLESAWAAGRAVLIEGDAGLGKSRLACDFAGAKGPYARVRSLPGDKAVPYATFTRALRLLAGPAPDLDGLPSWAWPELTRLMPEIGAAAPPPLQSAAEHNRFLEACTLAWLALAGDNFDAVIIDDWHQADAASQSLLAFIAQRRREAAAPGASPSGARELLLLRPELDAEGRAALQRLQLGCDALHVKLTALPPEQVLELLRRLSGVANPARFAHRLDQATAGNPFYLAETLRHLVEQRLLAADAEGIWHTPFDDATDDYRELPVPTSVQGAVLARVQRLPASAQRVLEAAALAMEPFAPRLLAPACALSEMEAVVAIETALEAQLLREHESGGFAFAHDLVQQSIDASLPTERRRLVHRRLALGAEAAGAPAAVVALHHEASGDPGRAVSFRLAAGDEAEGLRALTDAIGHWRLALADGPTPRQALDLHLRLMRTAHLTGQHELGLEHTLALQTLAQQTPLSPAERQDTLILVARHLLYNERQPEGLALLDSLPEATSELQRAQALNERAGLLRELGRVDEAASAARRALAIPEVQGRLRANLLSTLALIEQNAGRMVEAAAVIGESIAIGRQLGDSLGVARGHYHRGTVLSSLGQLPAAEADLLEAVELCKQLGATNMQRAALYGLCFVHSAQTRPDKVLDVARQGWSLTPPIEPGTLRLMYRVAFVDSHCALGSLGAAWEHAAAAMDETAGIQEVYAVMSVLVPSLELLGLLGEQDRAAPLLAMVTDDALRQMPEHAGALWQARGKLALLQGDIAAAAQSLAASPPAAELSDPRSRAALELLNAELALAEGDATRCLAGLPADDTPGMNDELRLRALALRVSALAAGGALPASTTSAALEALASGRAHAVAALYLHRALAEAQAAAVPGAPDGAIDRHQAWVARLLASLDGCPAQQAAFARAWR